jgi:hypothetical protein
MGTLHENQYTFFLSFFAQSALEWEMFRTEVLFWDVTLRFSWANGSRRFEATYCLCPQVYVGLEELFTHSTTYPVT